MKAESSIWLRTILMAAIALVTLALQGIGTLSLINGTMGDRDALKQRIAYWATVCSTAFSVTIYFLSRWFTKDIYWQWASSGSKAWAATPSLLSVRLAADLGGVTGVAMGLSMTIIALVSLVLNIWLTSMSEVAPYSFLSDPAPHTLSGIGGYNVNDTALEGLYWTNGAAVDGLVVQMPMGHLGQSQLAYYQDRYFWVPIFPSDQPATLLLHNLTTFSLTMACTRPAEAEVKIFRTPDDFINITAPCANFTLQGQRPLYNSWFLCRDKVNTRSTWTPFGTHMISYIIQANDRFSLGTPFWSQDKLTFYATKCVTNIDSWSVDTYISSYNVTRGRILSAVENNSLGISFLISRMLDGLGYFSLSSEDNGSGNSFRSPLWQYLVGWTHTTNTTDYNTWVASRLIAILTSTIDSSLISSNFTVTARLLEDSSIIHVNKVAVMAGIGLQAFVVGIIILLYICFRNDEYRADDLDLLLETHASKISDYGKDVEEKNASHEALLDADNLSDRYNNGDSSI
ncbi:hypothetical protein BG004_005406 [Podila humilis]|nr:hypothetical protein BG004_005406 [Podila humilis]